MTTAELGLVTTAIVGVAAAASPALVSWANRKHERAMARSRRLYEQRRKAYQDLAVYLDQARLWIEPGEKSWPKPPTRETADEWIDLMARAAVTGPAELQAKLASFHEAEFEAYLASGLLEQAIKTQDTEKISERKEYVEKTRSEAFTLIDEAEQAMRDELATL
jgi:hypothetical protein